ncbi:MAG: hypothetical protein RR090_08020 [Niameybacter sp.]|uniref:hypothetical protein n=1 Tax=Niameybacter sp. TaxID=2033640 RepID=UPI002FC9775E
MNYYIIFQNKTCKVEPNLEEISEGDMIFTYSVGTIVSVGTVVKKAYPSNEPYALEVQYEWLEKKVHIKQIFARMRQMLGEETTPFAQQGRRAKGGLYPISSSCGELIMEKILAD